MTKIGEKLKELRVSRGLRQDDVAQALGISRGAVSNVEKGKRSVTLNTLKKYCDFYKVDISYFEIETEKNELTDLLERARILFESENITAEEKTVLYEKVMRLYIASKDKNI